MKIKEPTLSVQLALMVSESAKKRKPSDYLWYKYIGTRTRKYHDHNPMYDLDLERKETFGIRVGRKYSYLVPEDMPDTEFRLSMKETKLLLDNSQGWSGKVGRTKVQAGKKGMDVSGAPKQQGAVDYEPERSNTKEETSDLTKSVKSIKFPGMGRVKHLTTQRTLLGEVYHYYDVTATLNAYRRKHGLPVDREGDWAIELEQAVEKANSNLDAEISSMRYKGDFIRVMSISEEE